MKRRNRACATLENLIGCPGRPYLCWADQQGAVQRCLDGRPSICGLQGVARDVALLLLDLRDHWAEADDVAVGLVEPTGLDKELASQHRKHRQIHSCRKLGSVREKD